MANVSIKSEKITPFGGIFHVMEQFDRHFVPVIDEARGLRSGWGLFHERFHSEPVGDTEYFITLLSYTIKIPSMPI